MREIENKKFYLFYIGIPLLLAAISIFYDYLVLFRIYDNVIMTVIISIFTPIFIALFLEFDSRRYKLKNIKNLNRKILAIYIGILSLLVFIIIFFTYLNYMGIYPKIYSYYDIYLLLWFIAGISLVDVYFAKSYKNKTKLKKIFSSKP